MSLLSAAASDEDAERIAELIIENQALIAENEELIAENKKLWAELEAFKQAMY